MIHFGKVPNEDKVQIEVSGEDLVSLRNLLSAAPLPERQGPFYYIKEVVETDPDLNRYLKMGGASYADVQG